MRVEPGPTPCGIPLSTIAPTNSPSRQSLGRRRANDAHPDVTPRSGISEPSFSWVSRSLETDVIPQAKRFSSNPQKISVRRNQLRWSEIEITLETIR
jgi:hypothetical protein